MEIYLISNNLHENRLVYASADDLDKLKKTRPLSIEGEALAKSLALEDFLEGTSAIYSSLFASAIASAKYLAQRLDKNVYIDENLDDALIGNLGNNKLSKIKFMQDHDVNMKLSSGESLMETGERIDKVVSKIINMGINNKVAIYTHKRAILAFLLNYTHQDFNLDDELMLEFNDNVVFSEEEKDLNLVKITIMNKKIVDIKEIIYE